VETHARSLSGNASTVLNALASTTSHYVELVHNFAVGCIKLTFVEERMFRLTKAAIRCIKLPNFKALLAQRVQLNHRIPAAKTVSHPSQSRVTRFCQRGVPTSATLNGSHSCRARKCLSRSPPSTALSTASTRESPAVST
jgi:hypothetical protein